MIFFEIYLPSYAAHDAQIAWSSRCVSMLTSCNPLSMQNALVSAQVLCLAEKIK